MTTLDMACPPDPEVLDAFERDGCVVLRDVITPEWREQAAAVAMRLLAGDRTLGRDCSVDGKDGFRGIVAMDDTFLPLVTNPMVLPTLVALLSANLHLMSSNLIYMPSIPPGGTRTIRVPDRHGWHRDMGAAARDLGTSVVPRLAIKAAYFLSDLTPDAGVTMVLPGSHTDIGPVTVPAGAIDPPGAITPD
ncbi:phytanoyl-CoA dioxygenase family protein, partial [Streptomyces sp. 2MCAF27]